MIIMENWCSICRKIMKIDVMTMMVQNHDNYTRGLSAYIAPLYNIVLQRHMFS